MPRPRPGRRCRGAASARRSARWIVARRSSITWRSRSASRSRAFSAAWLSDEARMPRSLSTRLSVRLPSAITRPSPCSRSISGGANEGSCGRPPGRARCARQRPCAERGRALLPQGDPVAAPRGDRAEVRGVERMRHRPCRDRELVALDQAGGVGVKDLDRPLDQAHDRRALVVERADEREEVGELAGRPALGQRLVHESHSCRVSRIAFSRV